MTKQESIKQTRKEIRHVLKNFMKDPPSKPKGEAHSSVLKKRETARSV